MRNVEYSCCDRQTKIDYRRPGSHGGITCSCAYIYLPTRFSFLHVAKFNLY